MLNVILKSFDGCHYDKPVLERAFQGKTLGTCISISNDTKWLPELDAEEHIWEPAEPLRSGEYPNVDWSTIAPVDEELMEQMRNTEATFHRMIERYAQTPFAATDEQARPLMRSPELLDILAPKGFLSRLTRMFRRK